MANTSGIVIFNSKTMRIISFSLIGEETHPIDATMCLIQPIGAKSVNALLRCVLNYAEERGIEFQSYEKYDMTWYDIVFIDVATGCMPFRYGIAE